MKRQNTQVRRNGSATRAAKQAATVTTSNNAAPAAEPTTLAIICEDREVARIEYSAEEFGRLERARAALNCSLEEFFEAAIKEKLPELEARLTAAAARSENPFELEHAIDQAHALTAQEQTPNKSSGADLPAADGKLPPLKRQSVIADRRPDMEEAFHYAVGLLELFAQMDGAVTERGGQDHAGAIGCGLMNWGNDLVRVLHADCYAAYDASKGDARVEATRRLGVTIGKVRALLLMLAHDLSAGGQFDAYDGARMGVDLPGDELSPFLSLASDCIEYLEVSFYDKFGRLLPMNSVVREIEEELLQKFAQPAQERAAA